MDRGLIHKSSPLVGEMGEGHGWWSVNNLRPPFEQHNPSLLLPSTTTASSSSNSHINSFSSLLLSNHYPLPTTSAAPWHDSSNSTQGQQLQDPWSHLFVSPSASGGLAHGEERYKNWEGPALFPGTTTAGVEGDDGSSSGYSYRSPASHGTGSSPAGDEIQLAMSSPPPWARGIQHHHNTLQQQASSARSSSITSTTSTTSLGSSMLEFSNSGSPRECLSTASGAAFKKARTQQEPSPALSTVKVRKEKLGDRITALHQLVSPFGKTDTASVLLEAIGYIRFLHGQIEGLSSPYQLGGGNGSGSSVSKQQDEATVVVVLGLPHLVIATWIEVFLICRVPAGSRRSVRLFERMFTVCYSSVHLLELVAHHCRLSYHSYVREVGGDGSVLGGVELEIPVVQEGATPTRVFFWSGVSADNRCPYEESALQAVRFLQGLYGFVVRDFGHDGMSAYRELASSAIVLAVTLARSVGPASRSAISGSLESVREPAQWQTLCNQLICSACDM